MNVLIILLSVVTSIITNGQLLGKDDLANTALIIGAGDEGRGDDVEFWPQRDESSCRSVENLPFSLFSHSAAVLGHHVFTCGGSRIPDTLDDCYAVDVAGDGVWQPAPSMRQNRKDFSLIAMEDYLLAIGGLNGSLYLDSVEIFDGESWTMEKFKLINPRYAHCSVKINDEEILVLGGGGYDGRLTSVEKVNIVQGTSIVFGSMTMTRMYFGCSFSEEENRVYVSGGWGTTSLVEYLDLNTQEWTRIANLNIGRDGHQMEIIGGKLTVFGGSGHDYNYIDSVEQYQARENTWEMVESMQAARYSMGMVPLTC